MHAYAAAAVEVVCVWIYSVVFRRAVVVAASIRHAVCEV